MASNKVFVVLMVCTLAFVALAADEPAEKEDLQAEGNFHHGVYAAPYAYGGYYGGYPYGYGYGHGYGHGFYGHGLGYGYGFYG